METKEWEQDFYGKNVSIATREDDCSIYRIKSEYGDTVLTRYEVYPGIALVYNDVHTQKISIEKMVSYHNILEINHCREGRIEFESADGNYLYIKKGDMAINTKSGVKEYSYFPQCHYHGVTIELDLDVLQKNPISSLEEFQLDPVRLKNQFCKNNWCFIIHEKDEFEHLFAELYCVPEKIRKRYYKLKVIEILLFLSAIDRKKERLETHYFNKDLVARVKEAHEYMISHLDEKITIDDLTIKYNVSQTNLKRCFREVYGNSIYAYQKEFRIHSAARLLKDTDMEIGLIAGMVGYDNASKFSRSFKSIIGINPSEYRKSV